MHRTPLLQTIQRTGGKAFQRIADPTAHFFADYRLTVIRATPEFFIEPFPKEKDVRQYGGHLFALKNGAQIISHSHTHPERYALNPPE